MSKPAAQVQVFGIVPAAGSSRRMGRPKPSLPYGDSTMVGILVRTLLNADLDGVVVVTRSELAALLDLPSDPRLVIVYNDDANSEMIDSVRVGLMRLVIAERLKRRKAETQKRRNARMNDRFLFSAFLRFCASGRVGVLIVPADMPAIRVETYRACRAAFADDPGSLVIAANDGRLGHPIIFPWSLRADVMGLHNGLRELTQIHADRVRLVETGDPGVTRDVDSPDDYERLRSAER
ncbi:MAG: nucleotidyltransferase family protein [Planctomycetota bacterium]